jgi:hypothetical protein
MGLFCAGKQKYNNCTVGRKLEGVHSHGMPAVRYVLVSAVEPGHGRASLGSLMTLIITQ